MGTIRVSDESNPADVSAGRGSIGETAADASTTATRTVESRGAGTETSPAVRTTAAARALSRRTADRGRPSTSASTRRPSPERIAAIAIAIAGVTRDARSRVARSSVPYAWGSWPRLENTADEHFMIDRHPEMENVWIAGGGSGHGFKHGPALGNYIARRVVGEDPDPEFAELWRLKT
jgi:glycine/D-amino acid oxidase-like deaminating enzyme